MQKFIVGENQAGRKLEKLIRSLLKDMPLSAIYKAFRTGKIKVNGKKAKEKQVSQEGDVIDFFLSKNDKPEIKKTIELDYQKIKKSDLYKKSLKVIYEDDDVLVLDKPDKIAVHPGSNHYHGRTMLDLARAHTGDFDDFQTTLVHRLDLDTSGVLLFAKNGKSLRFLNDQMKQKNAAKQYHAICLGKIKNKKGSIELSLKRTSGKNKSTKIIVSKSEDSKQSITHYEVIKQTANWSLIKIDLETGRMHQIRVHMQSIGHPIIGDSRYGDFKANRNLNCKRMFLHASKLEIKHPTQNQTIKIVSKLPESFNNFCKEYP